MIAKIKTRTDFGGIVNYANDQKNKKKSATLLAHEGVCTISNKAIADFFQIQASMRPKVKSPVKHVSLAFLRKTLAVFPIMKKSMRPKVKSPVKHVSLAFLRKTLAVFPIMKKEMR